MEAEHDPASQAQPIDPLDYILTEEDRRGLDIAEFALLMQEYRAAIREVRTKFEILDEDFTLRYRHNPIHSITSRLKSPQSLLEKLHRKGFPVSVDSIRENIYDVAGVRVVCSYLDDMERLTEALLRQDDVKLVVMRDYVSEPKESGYRSLHVVVSVPVYLNDERREVNVEVQIRTIAMDFWATLEHRLRYKNTDIRAAAGPEMDDIRARLTACASQIASLDADMQQIQHELDELLGSHEETVYPSIPLDIRR